MAQTVTVPSIETLANDRPEPREIYGDPNPQIAGTLTELVKGAGMRRPGGAPLDDDAALKHAYNAEQALKRAVRAGIHSPDTVVKSISPTFQGPFQNFMRMATPQALSMQAFTSQIEQALAELGKNVSLTSPLSTGFVPFDLLAPARLLYPVYTLFRNKIPRVPGQGTSRRVKAITGISGTQTGSGNGPIPVTISEFNGGSFSNYPIALPASPNSTAAEFSIPYAFMGMSDAVSMLAQIAGQGFEDMSALVNLQLMQAMMLGEEYQMFAGTATALGAPGAPTVVVRNAGSNETAIPAAGAGDDYYIVVTATNPYGETTMSSVVATTVATQTGKVVDVTIAPVAGAFQYNVYVSAATATGSPPSARTAFFAVKTGVGATKVTLQGTLPSSGTNPPAADNTAIATSWEGIASVLSGRAITNSVYPSGWKGGYVNQSVGDTLNVNSVKAALEGVFDGPGAFRADPAELIVSGADARILSDSIDNGGTNSSYRLFIDQPSVGNVIGGVAVSGIKNPITQSSVKITVHPWLQQGTAFGMTYQLPMSFSEVNNAWEMTMVQDYLSVSWPVIDASFRYSIFAYGAPVAHAPQYSFIMQGLQVSNAAPYS